MDPLEKYVCRDVLGIVYRYKHEMEWAGIMRELSLSCLSNGDDSDHVVIWMCIANKHFPYYYLYYDEIKKRGFKDLNWIDKIDQDEQLNGIFTKKNKINFSNQKACEEISEEEFLDLQR